jgi:hypothetical protein
MKSNLNTILIAIALATLCWIGVTTAKNATQGAVTAATLKRIEDRMGQTVERREYDLAIGEIRSRLANVEAEQARLKLDIVKLQGANARSPSP